MFGHLRRRPQSIEQHAVVKLVPRFGIGRQGVPRHQIRAVEVMTVRLARLMHGEQVRMRHRRLGPCIGQKSLDRPGLPRLRAFEHMQHDMARHALLPGHIVFGRPVLSGRFLQIVGSDGRPDGRIVRRRRNRSRSHLLARQTDRRRQLLDSRRLAQHRGPRHALGVIGQIVATDKNRAHRRELAGQHFAQLETVHWFHRHIGHQNIGAAPGPRRQQSLAAGRGRAHLTATHRFQQCPPRFQHVGLVINQQNLHHGAKPSSPGPP